MSKLDDLIKKLCPNGVEYKKLGDIGQVKMCKRILKSQTNIIGGIPFYKIGTFGGEANSFISKELYEEYKEKYSYPKIGEILISASGTIGRTVVYDGEPAYYQDSNIVWLSHNESDVLNTFLKYCYELKPWNISSGGTIARLYNDNILKAKIPVPPLEVQREIVRILDTFTELNNKLNEELEYRKKQYVYYRDLLLSDDVLLKLTNKYSNSSTLEYKKLGDVCEIKRGKVISKKYIQENKGIYPVYSSQTENNGELGKISTYMFNGEYVTWTTDGAHAGSVFYRNGKFNITNVCGLIKPNNILNTKFLYYILNTLTKKYVNKGMGNAKLMSNIIELIQIPIPPLEVQEKIVEILDTFTELTESITDGLPAEIDNRNKQYTYYRDKLLSF